MGKHRNPNFHLPAEHIHAAGSTSRPGRLPRRHPGMLNPDQIIGFLKALEALNSGTNQQMNCELVALPPSTSLEESLGIHFARMRSRERRFARRSKIKGESSHWEEISVGVTVLPDIRPSLRSWLFTNAGPNRDVALAAFVELLSDCLNWTESHRITGHGGPTAPGTTSPSQLGRATGCFTWVCPTKIFGFPLQLFQVMRMLFWTSLRRVPRHR